MNNFSFQFNFRSRFLLAMLGLVLLIGMAGCSISKKEPPKREFVAHSIFIEKVKSAAFGDYKDYKGTKVRSKKDFEEMKQHILKMYEGVKPTNSFIGYKDVAVDCIPFNQQPGLRGLKDSEALSETPELPARLKKVKRDKTGPRKVSVVPPHLKKGKKDKLGNNMYCKKGTIPMRRITLEEMIKFEDLNDFFRGETPGGGSVPVTHYYAHARQTVDNYGGASWLNIWNPTTASSRMSLSQQWYTGGSGSNLQTLEGGWQNYPGKYGTSNSVLFIYWTADGYGSTGCYNLDCSAFVQTNNNWYLGGQWDHYSTQGGTQWGFKMVWYRSPSTGSWWLYLQGPGSLEAVGYYPASKYGDGILSRKATKIDYGGEDTGKPSAKQMGSGQFANQGWQKAAFQKEIYYFPTAGGSAWANLSAIQNTPTCYTIDLHNIYGSWGTYFYYGGSSCN